MNVLEVKVQIGVHGGQCAIIGVHQNQLKAAAWPKLTCETIAHMCDGIRSC